MGSESQSESVIASVETQKQYLLLGRDGGLASRVACVGGAINT